jgi:hypothetical protein
VNVNQPFDAFNVPITIADPGPDGRVGTSDDGPGIRGSNLDAAHLALTPLNVTQNVPNSSDDYYTWEITANKRYSRRWSLLATFALTQSYDNAGTYFGQRVRANTLVLNPNDMINSDDGRYAFSAWTMKLHGTYEAPFAVHVTPILRVQSGQPIGRVFVATFNYGTANVLAEPIGTRKQDDIVIFDVRAEKSLTLTGRLKLSGIVDAFNLFNSNAEQNTSYNSGTSFLRPLNIIPPRIVRVGARITF